MSFGQISTFWEACLKVHQKKKTKKTPNQPFNQNNINSPYLLTAKQHWSRVLLRSLPTVWYLGQSYHFFFDPLLNCLCTTTYRTKGEAKEKKKKLKISSKYITLWRKLSTCHIKQSVTARFTKTWICFIPSVASLWNPFFFSRSETQSRRLLSAETVSRQVPT